MSRYIKKYKTALKTIQEYDPINIRLTVEGKNFDGVEFEYEDDKDGYQCHWLLVRLNSLNDREFLDRDFQGDNFEAFQRLWG